MGYMDANYMVLEASEGTVFEGNNCALQKCSNYYYITYGKQYFHFVNWDEQNTQVATVRLIDFNAIYVQTGIASLVSAILVLGL